MSNTRFIFSILVTFAGSRNRENASNHKSSADVAKKKEKKKQFPNRNKQILKLKVFQNALALLFRIPLFFFLLLTFIEMKTGGKALGAKRNLQFHRLHGRHFPLPFLGGDVFFCLFTHSERGFDYGCQPPFCATALA